MSLVSLCCCLSQRMFCIDLLLYILFISSIHFYMLRHVNGGVLDETLVAGCCSWRFWYGLWLDGWMVGWMEEWVYMVVFGGRRGRVSLVFYLCTDGTYIFAS